MQELLQSREELFEKPKGLSPKRDLDNRIPLKENTTTIKSRPNRYPHIQKEEIEKQVTELLQQGGVQFSNNPFSSRVLLVKKHDGGWRMCVDYRNLNVATIKHQFPIPVTDELLDELHGVTYFSKRDLRSRYHQIRMKKEDIERTTFKTQHG